MKQFLSGYVTLTTQSLLYTKTKSTKTWTNRILASSLPGRSRRTVRYLLYFITVTRENNTLQTTVYREPTHFVLLLDQTSNNPTSHKRLLYEPWREEYKLLRLTRQFDRRNIWTLFLLTTTSAHTSSSNAILTSDRKTALSIHTLLKPLYNHGTRTTTSQHPYINPC